PRRILVMTGMEAHRPSSRSLRRRFFAAVATAGIIAFGLPVQAQAPRTASQSQYQPVSPATKQAGPATGAPGTAMPARAGTPSRPNPSVVPAQNVPLNQVTPRVANAPAPTSTIKPNPSQLQVMAVVNGEQISNQDLGRECLWRFGQEVLEG